MANNVFYVKRTATSGKTPNTTASYATNSQFIDAGELALNMADGILYTSNGSSLITIGSNVVNQNISNTLTVKSISANGGLGTSGQVLTSDGSNVYWSSAAGGGFSNGQSISVNNFVVTGAFTANSSNGSNGQYLVSNGAGVYWSNSNVSYIYNEDGTIAFAGSGASPTDSNNAFNLVGSNGYNYVQNTDSRVLSGNLNFTGANTYFSQNVYLSNTSVLTIGSKTINSTSFNGTSNNSTYAYGKAEQELNVNNALTSNNSTYAFGKTESNLNVNNALTSNSALTSNNSTYAFGKSESGLNVNNALTSNSASYLGGAAAADYQTTAGLASNVATLTSNNSTYAFGKTESALNVNNSLTSNNASYLGGNTASDLRTYTDNKAGNAYSNATSFASNATNISSGTLGEARLPYRMDQNVRTTDTVSFTNMTVTGNLTVSGNVSVIGSNNLSIVDNMIYLNSNSAVTNPDLGFAGNYNDGSYHHAGFFRDATDGFWKVFDNYSPEPDASPYIDTTNSTFHIADFHANTHRVGNTSVYATINSTAFSGSANNATYAFGKSESGLNVNSSLSSNNSTYAFGKSESALNVNSALTSNNSTYSFGKTEAALNVNSALTSNNSLYLGGIAANQYAYANQVSGGGGGGGGGASVTISNSAPLSANSGDLWWSSEVGTMFVYYNDGDTSQWVSVAPTSLGSTSGSGGESLSPFLFMGG